MPRNPLCEECPAHHTAKHICVWGKGESGGVMFVGEAPGAQEDSEGVPFIGPSGKLLRSVFAPDKAYFTNAIKCLSKPVLAHARACWHYLEEEINTVQPTHIIAVGEWASKILAEHGVEHSKIAHPSNVLQGRMSMKDWRNTMASKTRLPDIVPHAERIDIDSVDPFGAIAVDLETCQNADRELHRRIGRKALPVPWFQPSSLFCVGFAQGTQRWAYPLSDPGAREMIQRYLELPGPKVFHNVLYDLLWLQADGFTVEGDLHDTMWLLALQDEAAGRGLEVGDYVYPWWIPDDTEQLELVLSYCANDALNTMSLYHRDSLLPFFKHRLYRLYTGMARRLVQMTQTGLPKFHEPWDAAIASCLRESDGYDELLKSIAEINWESGDQVAAFLAAHKALPRRTTPSGKRLSVDEDALRRSRHPAASLLLQKRKVDTLLHTFLLPAQGLPRAHGVLALNRAATGRSAMSRMNLQNIPKDQQEMKQQINLRLLFGSEEYDWVKMDLVGAELVVIAVEANCPAMLECFREGRDIHKMMAGHILKKPPDQVTDDEKKRAGKIPNFTLCYGGNAPTLQQKAREEYGILLTDEEARFIVEEWFKLFPEVFLWHERVKLDIHWHRQVTSPMGRTRTVPFLSKHDYNVALNAPIQGTVTDLLLLGLDVTYPWPGELVNIVHDEVDLLIPKGSWGARRSAFREMGTKMAGVDSRFPMRVEIAVGPTWGGPWAEEFKVP